jgi:hypothetical protein
MADGETHEKWRRVGFIGIVVLEVGGIIYWTSTFPQRNEIFLCMVSLLFNYFLTRYISPDLDQLTMTSQEARMFKELSIFGLLGMMWWLGYAGIMAILVGKGSAHRSKLTHTIIPGTLIRMIWFNIPISLVLYFVHQKYQLLSYSYLVAPYLIGQFISWSYADIIHFTLDRKPQRSQDATDQRRNHSNRTNSRDRYHRGRGT